jgi:tetratricopeptide (TPR) repeat protein
MRSATSKISIALLVLAAVIHILPLSALSEDHHEPWDKWKQLMEEGKGLEDKGDFHGAIYCFRKALTEARSPNAKPNYLPETLAILTRAEVTSNQVLLAEPDFNELLTVMTAEKKAAKLDPDAELWCADTADSYFIHQEPALRELCLKHSASLRNVIYGGSKKETRDAYSALSHLYYAEGKFEESINVLSQVISFEEQKNRLNKDFLAETLNELALSYLAAHKYSEAQATTKKVIAIAEQSHGQLVDRIPNFYGSLGSTYFAQGKVAEGEQSYSKAIEIIQQKYNSTYRDKFLACTYLALGQDLQRAHQLQKAEKAFSMSVNCSEKNNPVNGTVWRVYPDAIDALYLLYRDSGQAAKAAAANKRSTEIRQHFKIAL